MAKAKEEFTTRKFMYNGSPLEDPDPKMSDADVKKLYEASFPELTNANLSIEIKDGVKTVSFKKSVGTKG